MVWVAWVVWVGLIVVEMMAMAIVVVVLVVAMVAAVVVAVTSPGGCVKSPSLLVEKRTKTHWYECTGLCVSLTIYQRK